MVIEGKVTIVNTTFNGPVDCSYATFEQVLRLNGSKFEVDVIFATTTIEKDVFLDKATFLEITIFRDFTVKGVFHCRSTAFLNRADFNRAIFKNAIFFNESTFKGGEAEFGSARIGGAAMFIETEFKHGVSFNHTQVEGSTFFNSSILDGRVDFINARIGGAAVFTEAKFKQEVRFDGVQIEGNANFNPAFFEGNSYFIHTRIGNDADFTKAMFKKYVSFDRIQIGGAAFFRPTLFVGEADFTSTQIGDNAYFSNAKFNEETTFNTAQFKKDTIFDGAVFEKDVSFHNTSFRTCFFGEPETQFPEKIDLRGCTYDRIHPTDMWRKLLDKERLEPYDRQPFTQLEETFRKAGEDRMANDVYYERKRREAEQLEEPLARLLDWIHKSLTGYGVKLQRIILAIVIILIAGTVVFQTKGSVEPKKGTQPIQLLVNYDNSEQEVPNGIVNGFLFSVKYFVPVHTPFGSEWKPSSKTFYNSIRYETCALLMKLLGWFFVPLGVAGLTGILKR